MRDTQRMVDEFMHAHGLHTSPELRLLDLVSELGEVAKEILTATQYGAEPLSLEAMHDVAGELGDVVFSLAALANALDVDLEEATRGALAKYGERITERGTAASRE